ncbi:MAG: hypothetical protein OHK93_001694 [Ramalina farinacea]|uniref:Ubiquitin-like domain-containing protein n=1 Tax=Ramalina farinacea TaxID=258253 RepID=A0AA43QUE0_9LECA|nr:hypothetical protein [Ramalina farinacea]
MPVVGLSVSDFVKAIELVGIIIDSLRASSKSSAELRELLDQLYTVEKAFQAVKLLEVDQSSQAELLAVKQSAAQCQHMISSFWDQTHTYQPQVLDTNGTGHTLQAKWSRLKWALCKKRKVAQFKTDLVVHMGSMQLLLGILQAKSMHSNQKGQEQARVSFISQIQAGFGKCMARLCLIRCLISDTLSTISGHANKCLENTRRIICLNVRVFQVVFSISWRRIQLHQLCSLKTALQEVKRLEVDESLHAEVLALKQSAAQCQRTISGFLDRTQAYQPQILATNAPGNTIQAKWMRLKWALCKKREVMQFTSDLLAHTESIQMLLSTLQMKSMQLNQKGQERAQLSLVPQIQAGFRDCMARLCLISDTLSTISGHANKCLENTRRIICLNVRVFQVVLSISWRRIQIHLKNIPGQVERQQPVYLNDALGRDMPFHLEFIVSWEALVSVLSINFKRIGSAAEKIQNGDFAIHDTHTKQDIELSRSWEECFAPGQHVEMSIIFDRPKACTNSCPKCRSVCVVEPAKDATW